jgi:phytoene dehydrogenase-like protein
MGKSIAIIGAGMGGLAAGIYGRMGGHETTIFEQHNKPGRQCASWKRKGYTFDACIHHLFGCDPWSRFYSLWEDLGAMPRGLAPTRECVAVQSPDGRIFYDYWDPSLLEDHLKEIAPEDFRAIEEYARAIPLFAKEDFAGDMMMGTPWRMMRSLPDFPRMAKWFKLDMRAFAARFSSDFFRRALPLLEYSLPDAPALLHMIKHAYGHKGAIAWPMAVRWNLPNRLKSVTGTWGERSTTARKWRRY